MCQTEDEDIKNRLREFVETKPIVNEVMLDEDQWRCEHCQAINRVNDWTDKT